MFSLIVNHFLPVVPVWVWPFAAGASITIFFLAGILSHFPEIKPYALFLKPVALICFSVSLFFYGGSGVVAIYQLQLKEAQQRADDAAKLVDAANLQLKTVLDSQNHLVQGRAYGIKKDIEANRVVINRECTLTDAARLFYNRASQNEVAYSATGTVRVSPATNTTTGR
jgi:hypothetical protein